MAPAAVRLGGRRRRGAPEKEGRLRPPAGRPAVNRYSRSIAAGSDPGTRTVGGLGRPCRRAGTRTATAADPQCPEEPPAPACRFRPPLRPARGPRPMACAHSAAACGGGGAEARPPGKRDPGDGVPSRLGMAECCICLPWRPPPPVTHPPLSAAEGSPSHSGRGDMRFSVALWLGKPLNSSRWCGGRLDGAEGAISTKQNTCLY